VVTKEYLSRLYQEWSEALRVVEELPDSLKENCTRRDKDSRVRGLIISPKTTEEVIRVTQKVPGF
jgi:hypothetical protein